jgi:hypothetical protein
MSMGGLRTYVRYSQRRAHGCFQAEIAAAELGFLSLENALALVILYRQEGFPKFEAAAVRWLAQLALEGRDVRLVDMQLASAALFSLLGLRRERAERTLLGLL